MSIVLVNGDFFVVTDELSIVFVPVFVVDTFELSIVFVTGVFVVFVFDIFVLSIVLVTGFFVVDIFVLSIVFVTGVFVVVVVVLVVVTFVLFWFFVNGTVEIPVELMFFVVAIVFGSITGVREPVLFVFNIFVLSIA